VTGLVDARHRPGLSAWVVPFVHRHDQAALELAHEFPRALREQLTRTGAS